MLFALLGMLMVYLSDPRNVSLEEFCQIPGAVSCQVNHRTDNHWGENGIKEPQECCKKYKTAVVQLGPNSGLYYSVYTVITRVHTVITQCVPYYTNSNVHMNNKRKRV